MNGVYVGTIRHENDFNTRVTEVTGETVLIRPMFCLVLRLIASNKVKLRKWTKLMGLDTDKEHITVG